MQFFIDVWKIAKHCCANYASNDGHCPPRPEQVEDGVDPLRLARHLVAEHARPLAPVGQCRIHFNLDNTWRLLLSRVWITLLVHLWKQIARSAGRGQRRGWGRRRGGRCSASASSCASCFRWIDLCLCWWKSKWGKQHWSYFYTGKPGKCHQQSTTLEIRCELHEYLLPGTRDSQQDGQWRPGRGIISAILLPTLM